MDMLVVPVVPFAAKSTQKTAMYFASEMDRKWRPSNKNRNVIGQTLFIHGSDVNHNPGLNRKPNVNHNPDLKRKSNVNHNPDLKRKPNVNHNPHLKRKPNVNHNPDLNRKPNVNHNPDLNPNMCRNFMELIKNT